MGGGVCFGNELIKFGSVAIKQEDDIINISSPYRDDSFFAFDQSAFDPIHEDVGDTDT